MTDHGDTGRFSKLDNILTGMKLSSERMDKHFSSPSGKTIESLSVSPADFYRTLNK